MSDPSEGFILLELFGVDLDSLREDIEIHGLLPSQFAAAAHALAWLQARLYQASAAGEAALRLTIEGYYWSIWHSEVHSC